MKTAATFLSLLLLSSVFTSCQNHKGEKTVQNTSADPEYNSENKDENYQADNDETESQQNAQGTELKYFVTTDTNNGLVISGVPFPATWKKENGGEYSYTGPGKIKVYAEKGSTFMFSNDAQINQMNQQSGMQIQNPKTIDQVIEEGFMPYANSINRKLIRKYPIPQLASFDKRFDDQLYKAMPSQKTFNVMGIEWQDPDGTKFLTVLHHIVAYDQTSGYWSIQYSVLETPENKFEETKKQYLNGLLNQQINPQWIAAVNQKDIQRTKQSNLEHQGRMDDIKAFGEQNTARHNARMASMDQNMDTWKANQAAGDRNQEQLLDYIKEKTNVTDPNTGQTFKVDAGGKQYWMNNNGEYIKSDDSSYDPNLDNGLNNQTWTEYKEN